jgi:hypothetical protein
MQDLEAERDAARADRDEARAAAIRASRERDQLRSELLNSRPAASNAGNVAFRDPAKDNYTTRTPPGGIAVTLPRDDTPLESLKTTTWAGGFTADEPSSSLQDSASPRRHSLPPEELRQALTDSSPPRELTLRASTSKPPLRQKPEASTRPLIGYSLAGEAVPEEQTPPRSSRTPER